MEMTVPRELRDGLMLRWGMFGQWGECFGEYEERGESRGPERGPHLRQGGVAALY